LKQIFQASFFHNGTRLKTFLRVFKGRSVSQAFCDRFVSHHVPVSFLFEIIVWSLFRIICGITCAINLIKCKSGSIDKAHCKLLRIRILRIRIVKIGSIGADCSNFLFVVIIFFCNVCAYTIIHLHGTYTIARIKDISNHTRYHIIV